MSELKPMIALDLLRCFALVLGSFVPVGFAVLKLFRQELRARDVGFAAMVGYAVVPGLVLAEIHLAHSILVLPTLLASIAVVGRDWRRLASRLLLGDLALPLLLAAWALFANVGDLKVSSEGVEFRAGFDVSDKAVYAMVAREVRRAPPPSTENPLFAGVRSPYSFFPSLTGLLLQTYAGIPLLPAFLLYLPCVSMVLTGLAANSLMHELGVESALARSVTVGLIALGGDLSFCLPADGLSTIERARYLFVFYSGSAESLLMNTNMLGIPALLALATACHRWLRDGGRAALVAAGLLSGALFETKLFALAPVIAAAFVLALAFPRRRPALLGVTLTVGVAPWIGLTLLTGSDESARFLIWPLAHVRRFLVVQPALEPLAQLALASPSRLVRTLGLWATLLGVIAGGLGLRLVGLPGLFRRARSDASGFHTFTLLAMVLALAATHVVGTQPLPLESAQFMVVPLVLLWPYAGPVLAESLLRPGRRLAAALGLALALVTPVIYVLSKRFPEHLTSPDSLDRLRQRVAPDAMAACFWLSSHAAPTDRLMQPIGSHPDDLLGFRSLYIAALSSRRVVATVMAYSADPTLVQQRRDDVSLFYETGDVQTAERVLDRWGVRWVWEDLGRPLRFRSARLRPAHVGGSVAIHEVAPAAR